MKTFLCVRCDSPPADLRPDFLAVRDSIGRSWVCREENPPHDGGSGWEGWAHYAGVAAGFSQFVGEVMSDKDPFETAGRIMSKTVSFAVDDESALPGALSAHKQ